uniref:Uncharacterized protein n=1 Tax=Panagrolaimus davidi TaxID=227884 RepID=A0A914PKS5_9BILA
MAYLDKPIKFKNLQASSADYHFRMYKTHDEDNMHMIELCDEKDIEFIYRLRLTTKELDKIRRENPAIPTDSIGYIQKFVKELSEEKWLTCETNAEGCNIIFYGIFEDLGYRCTRPVLKLSLLSVKGEELHQHFKYTALKYKKRYDDKKRENEERKKKAEDYEKKIRQLEAEVKEKIKLKKNYEILDFDFKIGTLKFTVENQGKIIEEINGNQKLAVPNKNVPTSTKPRTRPWVLGNATLPNR